jgi:hypothetical protein
MHRPSPFGAELRCPADGDAEGHTLKAQMGGAFALRFVWEACFSHKT